MKRAYRQSTFCSISFFISLNYHKTNLLTSVKTKSFGANQKTIIFAQFTTLASATHWATRQKTS